MATFITSKLTGETININVQTSTGYWKYNHNGSDSIVFDQGGGTQTVEVLNANGEFTIISCLSDGTVNGDITTLYLDDNQLTEFDGTGLSGLTGLYLSNNQLTGFTGTGLSSLTGLALNGNLLTGLDVSPMVSLTNLSLFDKGVGNPLTALANDSILGQLVTNGLYNGTFVTIGGRTAASNDDYDTLFNYRAWTITGADLVSAVRKLRVKGVGQLNP